MKQCCKQLTDEKEAQVLILSETVAGLKLLQAQAEEKHRLELDEARAEAVRACKSQGEKEREERGKRERQSIAE